MKLFGNQSVICCYDNAFDGHTVSVFEMVYPRIVHTNQYGFKFTFIEQKIYI